MSFPKRREMLVSAGAAAVGLAAMPLRTAVGAVSVPSRDKRPEVVNVRDFGAVGDGVADDTAAFQKAMLHLLDRFEGAGDFYHGNPHNWHTWASVDRRTGRIYVPAGRYKVTHGVFSNVRHPRAAYCGFDFLGDHSFSSILELETKGADAWFYDNGPGNHLFQHTWWRNLGFRTDDYRFGNVLRQWSEGGPKQFRFDCCHFENLHKFMQTEGNGNADLTKVFCCTGQFFGDLLTLNNEQSVQHDFIGCDIGCYGNYVRLKKYGGGNVNITNSSIDFIWLEGVSPPEGNHLFRMDDDAEIGIGNATFSYRDLRIEVEAYKKTPGPPPFGLARFAEYPNQSMPRVVFDNVNFVNGQTYTIDEQNEIVSSERRRITAVKISPHKLITFRDCVLCKNFFYEVAGVADMGSPPYAGMIKFENCFDGILDELPAGDGAFGNLHARVLYSEGSSGAGRVVTEGMQEHTGGSPFDRHVLDGDPQWMRQFAREPSSTKRVTNVKFGGHAWPDPTGANEFTFNVPPSFFAFRVFLRKDASGASGESYQLHLGSDDKSVTIASSAAGALKDEHLIDLSHVDLSAHRKLRVWATGTATTAPTGGIGYIEHV